MFKNVYYIPIYTYLNRYKVDIWIRAWYKMINRNTHIRIFEAAI